MDDDSGGGGWDVTAEVVLGGPQMGSLSMSMTMSMFATV
jgi:hypothetical protein